MVGGLVEQAGILWGAYLIVWMCLRDDFQFYPAVFEL